MRRKGREHSLCPILLRSGRVVRLDSALGRELLVRSSRRTWNTTALTRRYRYLGFSALEDGPEGGYPYCNVFGGATARDIFTGRLLSYDENA